MIFFGIHNHEFILTFVLNLLTTLDLSNVIVIGCDHAGFLLKEYLKTELTASGFEFHDFGTFSEESADYPDYIHPLAKAINSGEFEKGIIICGSANGVSIVANKYPNVRAAVCWNEEVVKLARLHNDANIIALPARFITKEEALGFVRLFFSTRFEGGRHQRRVDKIPPH
jgi:ribose 5-phosphate isomerase B